MITTAHIYLVVYFLLTYQSNPLSTTITLKQTPITIAAAAVSVCASPLSVASTATVIVAASEVAVAGPSKPLEGKELEEFMTSEPHVPDGATNTNTTLSLGLLQFTRAHPGVNLLTKRSGCCNQGQCPDHNAAFEFTSRTL
jgi:hypothetical protein